MVYSNVSTFEHIPVLLKEVLHGLVECLRRTSEEAKVVVDATAGGLGHSKALASHLEKSDTLICIDKDTVALENKIDFPIIRVHDSFENIEQILKSKNIDGVDVILADLGVSSYQIDTAERGFSYMKDGKLDMRMDQSQKRDAYHVVNNYTSARLETIIKELGEERYAKMITKAIVDARPVTGTKQLAKIITDAVPKHYCITGGHPAKRTFQAIRMEVNHELEVLEKFVYSAVNALKKGGRIAIITFHSLEDRIVKHVFKYLSLSCTCPPKSPKCVCGKVATLKILTKKPILPSIDEQNTNPRAASAKLRLGERI